MRLWLVMAVNLARCLLYLSNDVVVSSVALHDEKCQMLLRRRKQLYNTFSGSMLNAGRLDNILEGLWLLGNCRFLECYARPPSTGNNVKWFYCCNGVHMKDINLLNVRNFKWFFKNMFFFYIMITLDFAAVYSNSLIACMWVQVDAQLKRIYCFHEWLNLTQWSVVNLNIHHGVIARIDCREICMHMRTMR